MTGNRKNEGDALDRLADVLVDDILNVSDEEILAEATEHYGDPEKLVASARALFERAAQEAGKRKLAVAKEAVVAARRQGGTVLKIDIAEARRRYAAIVANDSELHARLTMAARKGEGQSQRDFDSAVEDLAELGALDVDSEEKDGDA